MKTKNNFVENLENKLMNPDMDLGSLTAEKQFDIIASKVALHPEAIIPKPTLENNELLRLLKESKETGKPLRVKFGVDPTGPSIHIGHAVSLLMLRRFQWMGHHIDLVVGDFTAKIGDPTDRVSERKVISDEQISRNMATYVEQASKIVDLSDQKDVSTYFNAEWLSKMTMSDWVPLLQKISGNKLIEREDFTKRLQAGSMVSAAEMMYPLFMAYDSVVIKPDIELGGVDQLLNLHWCRELMKISGLKSETFIMVDLIAGTTGEMDEKGQLIKMSKSKDNYIMVIEEPSEAYGKVMSIPDNVMWIWFRELTEITTEDLSKLKSMVKDGEFHPMDAKRLLARSVVASFNHYDKEIVQSAEQAFNQKFGKNKILIPEDIQELKFDAGSKVLDLLSEATGESKATLRKMTVSSEISGVKLLVDGEYKGLSADELSNNILEPGSELIIKVGKRRYFRISAN